MPRANQYTIELRRQTAAYSQERDRQIIANSLALIDPVTQDLEDRLLVLINRGQGGGYGVSVACTDVWMVYVEKLAATMEKLLLRQIQWSYEASTEALIASLPMKFWVLRAAPAGEFAVAVEHREPAGVGFVEEVSFEDEYQRIIDGESSRQEAIDIVREMEFPPPDADTIDRYLTQTSADDGLSAMERIKTVEPARVPELQQIITDAFSDENLENASALDYASSLIRELVGNDPGKPSGMNYRAKRIARTEGVRISQQALHDSWDAVDDVIAGRQWFSALAPNTRPDHAERHRKIYHKRNGEYIADDGEVQPTIPLGPNCVLPGQAVGGQFLASLRAEYSGQAVEVTTEAGVTFSITPNHRVLTSEGFVAAGLLKEGDKLLRNGGVIEGAGPFAVESADVEHKPVAVEQVFRAIAESGSARSLPVELAECDFDGDEIRCEGEVDIVWPDGELSLDADTETADGVCEQDFVAGDMQSPFVPGDGTGTLPAVGVGVATPAFPHARTRFVDELLTIAWRENLPLLFLCFGACSELHTRFFESFGDDESTDARLFGKLLDRFPDLVAVDQVVKVRQFDYSGHVYDLQTEAGWYACNGIIIHNCLCWDTPIFHADLTAGLPPENVPAWLDDDSLDQWKKDRAEKDRGAEVKRKAKPKKAKPVPKPKKPTSPFVGALDAKTVDALPATGRLGEIVKYNEKRFGELKAARQRSTSIYKTKDSQELLDTRSRFGTTVRRLRDAEKAGSITGTEAELLAKGRERLKEINEELDRRKKIYDAIREAKTAGESARLGKIALTEDDVAKLVAKAGDAYWDSGWRPRQGKPPYAPELFRKSDISGKGIRHYVKLPDGRLAHPDELLDARHRQNVIVIGKIPVPNIDWKTWLID